MNQNVCRLKRAEHQLGEVVPKPPKMKQKRKITHPLSGAQVGTRVHRSRSTRITMTHDFSPLALA